DRVIIRHLPQGLDQPVEDVVAQHRAAVVHRQEDGRLAGDALPEGDRLFVLVAERGVQRHEVADLLVDAGLAARGGGGGDRGDAVGAGAGRDGHAQERDDRGERDEGGERTGDHFFFSSGGFFFSSGALGSSGGSARESANPRPALAAVGRFHEGI